MTYPTHGVYYAPFIWQEIEASFYMHGCQSLERAVSDAKQLAEIDDTGYYLVRDYEKHEVVFRTVERKIHPKGCTAIESAG